MCCITQRGVSGMIMQQDRTKYDESRTSECQKQLYCHLEGICFGDLLRDNRQHILRYHVTSHSGRGAICRTEYQNAVYLLCCGL